MQPSPADKARVQELYTLGAKSARAAVQWFWLGIISVIIGIVAFVLSVVALGWSGLTVGVLLVVWSMIRRGVANGAAIEIRRIMDRYE